QERDEDQHRDRERLAQLRREERRRQDPRFVARDLPAHPPRRRRERLPIALRCVPAEEPAQRLDRARRRIELRPALRRHELPPRPALPPRLLHPEPLQRLLRSLPLPLRSSVPTTAVPTTAVPARQRVRIHRRPRATPRGRAARAAPRTLPRGRAARAAPRTLP